MPPDTAMYACGGGAGSRLVRTNCSRFPSSPALTRA